MLVRMIADEGFVQGAVTYVDHTGKFMSTKVIAKKLAALVNLDELLLGDGAAEENEVDYQHLTIRSQSTSTCGSLQAWGILLK